MNKNCKTLPSWFTIWGLEGTGVNGAINKFIMSPGGSVVKRR